MVTWKSKFVFTASLMVALAAVFASVFHVFAAPSNQPGVGSGAVSVDSYADIGIGTSTASNFPSRFVVVASSTPSNSLEIFSASGVPVFTISNSGNVTAPSSTISANALIGALTGTVTANNISSGQFGMNTGGGNYYFSAGVGIGTTTANYELSVAGSMYSVEVDIGTVTGATAVDWSSSNMQTVTLGASPITMTFNNGQPGGHYTFAVRQDGSGNRTVSWPANVRWSSGIAPTLSTSANVTDYIEFIYNGSAGKFDGVAFNANF